jgi:signal-transduction protein with cAMP-binding, CBS, and nucleotidyltransferase domain
MSAPPVTIAPGATLRAAAQLMSARHIGALLVSDERGMPQGIITERDLLRAAAQGALDSERANIAQAMSAPVACMRAEEMLYRALGRMDRMNVRHLCVTDGHGAAVGMVSQRDMLQFRARSALEIGDAVASAVNATTLAAAYGSVPVAAERLVAEGIGGVEIARVVSSELRAVTARAAELVAGELRERGRDAPAPWCVLVLGSGGRGESLLAADQDNALIHAGTPADDAWFAEFGADVAGLLDEAGIPRCKGGVMASNAAWRGSTQQWEGRVAAWLHRARPEDLLNVDIFFDLAPVAGDVRLAFGLHESTVGAASRTPPFLALMAASVGALLPLLGYFGRLRTVNGRVDLKRCGILPIVSVARALALRIGSTERTTQGRLREASAAGRLSQADATVLLELHAELMTLVLRQQLADLEEGVRISNYVALKLMRRDEARALARRLRRLEEIVQGLGSAMAG